MSSQNFSPPPADSAQVGPALQKAAGDASDRTFGPPPHAVGPEKSILSSMLQMPQDYVGLAVEKGLQKEHFYVPAHGLFYEVLLEHYEAGREIELVALTQHLMDRRIIEQLGGVSGVTEIYSYAPTAAHFESHLEIVLSKHTLREVIRSCTEAISEAYGDPEDVAQYLDGVEQAVLDIRDATETQKESSISATVGQVLAEFEEFLSGSKGIAGLKTGYPDLDHMANGLKPAEIFIIAARPSMGKTSFMMNIVEHIALDQKKPTMVFSCEMSSASIVQRLLFARARFPFAQLRMGYKPNKQDLLNIKRATQEIASSKLFIDDTAAISINELRAKARRKKRDENIELIAVDYLQLMRSLSRQAMNAREREIAEISSGLKALAKELNIPIIVLAQLNRGPETRTGSNLGVPRLSDLRESGSIEQDADLVGLLYRKAYYQKGDEEEGGEEAEGEAELLLEKNRNGPTGKVPLTFLDEIMRFESASRREE